MKKRISAVVTVDGESENPPFDAKALIDALGYRSHPEDKPTLYGKVKRDGVCCLVLDVSGHDARRDSHVRVFIAAGASLANAVAHDRWFERATNDDCEQEVDATVTKLR